MKRVGAIISIMLFTLAGWSQWLGRDTDVPAYHPNPPAKGAVLGKLIAPEDVQATPGTKYEAMQRHAYALAAKIPNVIYQQPCYCHCDRSMGHQSLHSCYEGQHAAICAACLKEMYYTYVMATQKKKTPEQIRQGIVAGEWQSIDLETAGTIE